MYRYFFIFSFLLFEGCFLSWQPEGGRETPFPASETKVWRHLPQQNDPLYGSVVSDPNKRRLIALARAQLGTPYRYGGMDEGGFDCSGFVCYVYQNALQKKLPHSARLQSRYIRIYDLSKLEPGDLVFFDTASKGHINHVGIYLGNGKFIHASSGRVYSVTISDLTKGFYQKAFRFGGKVQR